MAYLELGLPCCGTQRLAPTAVEGLDATQSAEQSTTSSGPIIEPGEPGCQGKLQGTVCMQKTNQLLKVSSTRRALCSSQRFSFSSILHCRRHCTSTVPTCLAVLRNTAQATPASHSKFAFPICEQERSAVPPWGEGSPPSPIRRPETLQSSPARQLGRPSQPRLAPVISLPSPATLITGRRTRFLSTSLDDNRCRRASSKPKAPFAVFVGAAS